MRLSGHWLIFRRHLGTIDDEELHRPFLRLQLQPKLLLNCRENRRPGGLGPCAVSAYLAVLRSIKYRSFTFLRCPQEREIIAAHEPGLIQYGTTQEHRQQPRNGHQRKSLK